MFDLWRRLEETPGGGLGCMSCLLRAGIGSEEEVAQDLTLGRSRGQHALWCL